MGGRKERWMERGRKRRKEGIKEEGKEVRKGE